MTQIKDDNPDVALCASVVWGLPNGLRRAEIATLIRFSKDKTSRLLTINRRLGVLKMYGMLWVEPQFYDALREDAIAQAKMLKKTREAKRMLVKKLKEREAATPTNPNRLHAPNSVWQLQDFI
jgi:hypothetical protein